MLAWKAKLETMSTGTIVNVISHSNHT